MKNDDVFERELEGCVGEDFEKGERNVISIISQFKAEIWGVGWGEVGYMLLDIAMEYTIYHGINRKH